MTHAGGRHAAPKLVDALVGERVLSRFVVAERLGAGGYGTVYRAWDERLERPVAVKVIEGTGGPRSLREAQAVARLNHPAIVTLYELGEDEDRTYLVSELVDGASLRDLLKDASLSDRDIAEIGADLCDALEHAHSRGVVHRDVKPENVILAQPGNGRPGRRERARFGRALLADFGVASVSGAESLTASREVIGTLAYMAPEQAEGLTAGPEADIYSVGLVLYECWSGRNPVRHRSPAETARAIGEPQPSLAAARGDLPAELCELVDDCLDADPAMRPTVHEMREGFVAAAGRLEESRPLPPPDEVRPRRIRTAGLARAAALIALTAATVALATWLAMPGAALALALLGFPIPLLLGRAREWLVPALAPALGAAGVAPAFPAAAGLVRGTARAAAAALLGFGWLVLAEATLGLGGSLAGIDPAPPGWEESAGTTASVLFESLLAPEALLTASTWALSAALLALVLAAGSVVVRIIGGLLWAAALVSVQRLLPGWQIDSPEAATIAIAGIVVLAVWARSAPRRAPQPLERGERLASHPPARVGFGASVRGGTYAGEH
jgi:eukaryotic-like serine/threonine-protein kinase